MPGYNGNEGGDDNQEGKGGNAGVQRRTWGRRGHSNFGRGEWGGRVRAGNTCRWVRPDPEVGQWTACETVDPQIRLRPVGRGRYAGLWDEEVPPTPGEASGRPWMAWDDLLPG